MECTAFNVNSVATARNVLHLINARWVPPLHKFATSTCKVILNSFMKCWTGRCQTGSRRVKQRSASPDHHVRSDMFCDITQRRVVIVRSNFRTTYWYSFNCQEIQKREHSKTEIDTIFFFWGLCQLTNFLKKHDILEAGSLSVYRQTST